MSIATVLKPEPGGTPVSGPVRLPALRLVDSDPGTVVEANPFEITRLATKAVSTLESRCAAHFLELLSAAKDDPKSVPAEIRPVFQKISELPELRRQEAFAAVAHFTFYAPEELRYFQELSEKFCAGNGVGLNGGTTNAWLGLTSFREIPFGNTQVLDRSQQLLERIDPLPAGFSVSDAVRRVFKAPVYLQFHLEVTWQSLNQYRDRIINRLERPESFKNGKNVFPPAAFAHWFDEHWGNLSAALQFLSGMRAAAATSEMIWAMGQPQKRDNRPIQVVHPGEY